MAHYIPGLEWNHYTQVSPSVKHFINYSWIHSYEFDMISICGVYAWKDIMALRKDMQIWARQRYKTHIEQKEQHRKLNHTGNGEGIAFGVLELLYSCGQSGRGDTHQELGCVSTL